MVNGHRLERCCIVWLYQDIERLVPVKATDLEFDPNEIAAIPLSVDSVEQLLHVFEQIQHGSKESPSNATSVPSGIANSPGTRPHCSPGAVDATEPPPTTAGPTDSQQH